MVLLYFEKAHDQTEWLFVLDMLQAFGFPSYFCKQINILLKDSSTVIDINGDLSNNIKLQRSIRQGFPLSHFLYVLVENTLGYVLEHYNQMGLIKGMSIPDNSMVINSDFAE